MEFLCTLSRKLLHLLFVIKIPEIIAFPCSWFLFYFNCKLYKTILWFYESSILMILWIFYNCRNLTEIRCLVVCLESKYLSIWINYWIQCWFWLIYKRNKVDKIPDIACYYRVNSTRSKSSTHCNSITLANPFQQFYCIEDLFRSLIKDWDFDLPNGKFSFSKI